MDGKGKGSALAKWRAKQGMPPQQMAQGAPPMQPPMGPMAAPPAGALPPPMMGAMPPPQVFPQQEQMKPKRMRR